jgi:hypothetical protein
MPVRDMQSRVEYFLCILQMFPRKNKSLFFLGNPIFPIKTGSVIIKHIKHINMSEFDSSIYCFETSSLMLPELDEPYIKDIL